jgi:hypothetical protein
MTQVNPIAGAIAQTPQAQRLASMDRDAQVRRAHKAKANTDHPDQPAAEYIESPEAISAVHDDGEHADPRKKKRTPHHETDVKEGDANDESPPHIDIRA